MRTDELIKQSVTYELSRDTRLDASKIEVTVDDGLRTSCRNKRIPETRDFQRL